MTRWLLRRLLAEARYALTCLGYWVRPYDMLTDARRWRWQPRTPCGHGRFVIEQRCTCPSGKSTMCGCPISVRETRPR